MNKYLKKIIFLAFTVLTVFLIIWHYAYGTAELKYFPFNKKDTLKEWKEKIFHGRVLYEVKIDNNQGYLFAESNKASSGLFYAISFSPKKYPYISWRWKVARFPAKTKGASLNKKSWIERDDYALRFYVIFPAFIFTNTKCLEYVWSEYLPKGTILTSPFYRNIKLFVLETGSEKSGDFVIEERNILEDYKDAFGRYPAGKIGAIALMTDSDNTQSSSEGWYSDIKVGYEKPLYADIKERKREEPKPEGIQAVKEFIRQLLKLDQ